jgi:hypothetical protein
MEESTKEVGLFEKLSPGDNVRIIIKPRAFLGETLGSYVTAAKIASLQNDPRFKVNGWTYNDDGSLTLRVSIVTPPYQVQEAGISPWLIALIVVGASIAFVSVTTYKVADVIADPENPNAQKLASGIQLSSAALLIGVIGYLYISLKKG